jgi:hypothetical protein
MNGDFDLTQFFIDLFIGMLIGGLVGALIGRSRGRLVDGLGWGIILGPIGWLIVALLKDLRPKCPHCGSAFNPGASRCCHCGGDIRPPTPVSPMTTTLPSSNIKYYYSSNEEQLGPVDASDLRMMRKDGLITDDTPVIREGESQWRQFRDYLALNR